MASKAPQILTKRMAIDRANTQTVILVAVAAAISVFCLIGAVAELKQNSYQARVDSAQVKANNQLKQNLQNFGSLSSSYKSFVGATTNAIGGSSSATGGNNGSNGQIILDALPPSYDFPALASSIENILQSQGLKVSSITGTDDEVNQQSNTSSTNPQPVSMPFTFSISNATYGSVSQLIASLQSSIRPIQVDSFDLTGGSSNMTLTVNAHTYYQPGKTVNISQQVIK